MSNIIIDCSREANYAVAIVDDNGNLNYFSFENNLKKTIKSNIYLGRITRVEYSLQAAFVEYGGDKAGFLPFSEIHPDYYQLPIRDKQELTTVLREEEDSNIDNDKENDENDELEHDNEDRNERAKLSYRIYKKYNIQEVIKRGQAVLVQVVKDERGNKGVSLTTYISLAGRYCVLMPNSPRGLGVSKKIFSYEQRKRILNTITSFNVPRGTGLIVRTAGANATPSDLKRDYEYLTGLWDNIRNKAVRSKVEDNPMYEEVNVVKQVIRDNYESDNNSAVFVKGKKGYEDIMHFVKELMPHEAARVKLYTDRAPIFKKFGIDRKLDDLLNPIAMLPSGGYLVINPTEALVSIDVNSGKSIHGKNVEETALSTNLEAAVEVARQLRLRNLGGLIVVDFIDMDNPKNRRILEKELQRAFMFDKAKVQFAPVSRFGLIEISRQRIRSSVAEMLTIKCEHCCGTGLVKAPSVVSTEILDSVKEQLKNPAFAKKEFFEIVARGLVIDELVLHHVKEIEYIQRKYGVKLITTKQFFERNEEFILRALDDIEDKQTAVELYHALATEYAPKKVNTAKKGLFATLISKFFHK